MGETDWRRELLDSLRTDDEDVAWIDHEAKEGWDVIVYNCVTPIRIAYGLIEPDRLSDKSVWFSWGLLMSGIESDIDAQRFLFFVITNLIEGEVAEAEGPQCLSNERLLGMVTHEEHDCGKEHTCSRADEYAHLHWCDDCALRVIVNVVFWAKAEMDRECFGGEEG